MRHLILISLFVMGCSTSPKEQLHLDVEIGNTAVKMMQCKVLCDDAKVYAYTKDGLKCQCKTPAPPVQQIMRFELGASANETAYKGVMTDLSNGRTLMSVVPQK